MDKKLSKEKLMATCAMILLTLSMFAQKAEVSILRYHQGTLTEDQLAYTISSDPNTSEHYKAAAHIAFTHGIYNHGIISDIADALGINSAKSVLEALGSVLRLNPKAKLNDLFAEVGKQVVLNALQYSVEGIDISEIEKIIND